LSIINIKLRFKLFLKYDINMADFSLTTFASKGKLPQIENALAAVAKGETSLGIKAKNGVVIAT
jgi:20S proteasome alpha/beta subunit